MKERGILFTDAMVRAVLNGTKTQTRRLIKPQPPEDCIGAEYSAKHGDWMFMGPMRTTGSCSIGDAILMPCPYGVPGDRLTCVTSSIINLEITNIRVQRVQDISKEDAIAEGLSTFTKDGGRTIKYGIPDRDGMPGTDNTGWPWVDWDADPRRAFRRLWESIYGPDSWDANPLVWAITFRRLDAPARKGAR